MRDSDAGLLRESSQPSSAAPLKIVKHVCCLLEHIAPLLWLTQNNCDGADGDLKPGFLARRHGEAIVTAEGERERSQLAIKGPALVNYRLMPSNVGTEEIRGWRFQLMGTVVRTSGRNDICCLAPPPSSSVICFPLKSRPRVQAQDFTDSAHFTNSYLIL
ncbi:hypothetical protein AAFF_G00017800 [Aldrovandia affinis]|uniref:Uncharacterized protein n=1 Tax=Aldrovandia affinis TaxID=143900 RepID=A0AAD7S5U9_9TELE|nr:hypothetical protein AAFF_G00017800 [Aldrovandia affinis]